MATLPIQCATSLLLEPSEERVAEREADQQEWPTCVSLWNCVLEAGHVGSCVLEEQPDDEDVSYV